MDKTVDLNTMLNECEIMKPVLNIPKKEECDTKLDKEKEHDAKPDTSYSRYSCKDE
jgi:hypothetical protein